VRLFGPVDGLDLGNIKAFETHGRDIWVAGELGLARLNDQRFVTLHGSDDDAFTGISGLVARANGDLWASGHMGLIHIQRNELEHARKDPGYPVGYESFNYLDGLPGTAQQVFPLPSLIEGTDGRLWLSLHGDEGVAWIDPKNIYRNSLPPPVSILSISSAGRRFATTPGLLQLPIGTKSLQIQYMAGSLSIPERVHFRYRLEGSDSGWQDAGNRREAFYTNLAPGAYTFRVIAANNDGVWNNAGASIQLFIQPAFYQTRWFHAACMLVFLLLLLALHRVRLKAVRAEALGRLEERLAERERIARELHDTLLQSVQGLMLRFQAASERLPQHETARLQMESALVRAEKVMNEGRKRLKNLRTADSGAMNFVGALAATGELFAQNSATQFHASVEGAHRDLHPIVREEVLLIAREALANAFRHAQARTIETQLCYTATELYVRICDDGVGIDTDILNRGRPGHWGLAGMRERAKNIGARFTLSSEPAGGTAVELRIPADVAYQSQPGRTQKPFWRTERKL
jgi:signal transduction histidine kinase